jgi:lipid II:glycine glycyltransferase (peptidoglycan interpeptide bridge formation enzyme)
VYKFSITNDIKAFDDYVLNNGGSFFQTSMGASMKKNWTPLYFVGKDKNDKIVLTALLQVKRFFKVLKMGYFHSGFVCDYNNDNLIKEAIIYFKNETKKLGISFTFIDPEIILNKNTIKDNNGFNKLNEWNTYLKLSSTKEPFIQPKFTYILDLINSNDNYKTLEEVTANFEKGVRYSVRTAPSKGLGYEQYSFNDIEENPIIMDEFMSVMRDTMDRLETTIRSRDYYLNVLRKLKDYATLDMVYYDFVKDTNNYKENLEILSSMNDKDSKKNELKSKIDAYQKRKEELISNGIDINKTTKLYLAAGVTIFYGDKTTCLYGGTRNILRNATRSSHYLNYKRIENSVNKKMKYHDFLRAHVLYRDERDKNYGLSVFKKSFGANEIEYIGEFVIVCNHFVYFMFKTFYKKIRNIILSIKTKRR